MGLQVAKLGRAFHPILERLLELLEAAPVLGAAGGALLSAADGRFRDDDGLGAGLGRLVGIILRRDDGRASEEAVRPGAVVPELDQGRREIVGEALALGDRKSTRLNSSH